MSVKIKQLESNIEICQQICNFISHRWLELWILGGLQEWRILNRSALLLFVADCFNVVMAKRTDRFSWNLVWSANAKQLIFEDDFIKNVRLKMAVAYLKIRFSL